MSMNPPAPLSENERKFLEIAQNLINEVKGQKFQNNQFQMSMRQELNKMNTRIESEVKIVPVQAHEIQREVAKRVRHFLKGDVEYAKHKNKLYAAIWRDLKNAFRVAEYREIQRNRFNAAMEFVKTWQPAETQAEELGLVS